MPLPDAPDQSPAEPDPLSRFRNWRGFLAASVALNLLFIYGMLGAVSDPAGAIWYKTLAWLPFNAIATAVYLAIMARLADTPGALFYRILCAIMIVASWSVMFGA
ncbi:MAG: hypothetical protein Q8O33_02460 [Pseudomonadota bacterium]|nr:hypothetical protein [Pseudomonadota bacterium]